MLIASVSWLVGNSLCEAMRLIDRRRVYRLRYEDLCSHPQQTLRTLGDWLNLDLSDVAKKIEAGDELMVGHNIGGNHIRHAKYVTFDDKRAPRQPPKWVAVLTGTICFPLMRLYGYPLTSNKVMSPKAQVSVEHH